MDFDFSNFPTRRAASRRVGASQFGLLELACSKSWNTRFIINRTRGLYSTLTNIFNFK